MSHGLSASTFSPASTAARMRSILPRFLPEITTTLPGFSRSIRSVKSGPVWTSSFQLVGFSGRWLKAATRPRCPMRSGPSGAYTCTVSETPGYISF